MVILNQSMESYNKFNHIKVHSQYSICEGALKIENLSSFCKKNKIKAIGLSDTSNLCGALEFSENISKSGTQPILGTQINFKHILISILPSVLPFHRFHRYELVLKIMLPLFNAM